MSVSIAKYLRKTISFQVYPAHILGADFKYCKVVSVMDSAAAAALGAINPPALHSQVYPTLPSELLVADDYDSYNYAKVQLQDGSFRVIGEVWIIESSIEQFETGTITVTLLNKSVNDVDEVKRVLAKNGITPHRVAYKED